MEEPAPLVLVVDDNAVFRTLIEQRLRRIDCETALTSSGEQALSLLERSEGTPFDLILLDQNMSGLSGTDVLEQVRTWDENVPVIMLTSHGSVTLAANFMRERAGGAPGGTEFLEKPIPSEPLFGTLVWTTIRQGRLRRQAAIAVKEAERSRQEREADQQLFLESLPYSAILLDGNGIVRMVNDSYHSETYDGVARVGDDYLSVCGRSVLGEQVSDGIGQVLAGERERFECTYERAVRGRPRWWRLHACRLATDTPGAIVSHFDISIEVETRRRLENARNRLDTLAAHLPVAAILFRDSGTDLRVTFARGIGVAPVSGEEGEEGETESMTIGSVFAKSEGCEMIAQACYRALQGEAQEIEHRQNGRNYLVKTQPIWDGAGRVVEGLCVRTDITSLQQARSEAERNAHLVERVIVSSFGVFVYDLVHKRIVFQNTEFGRITGWSPACMAAMTPSQFQALFHPEDQPLLLTHIEALCRAADEEVLELSYRFLTANGNWRWFSSRDAVFERDDAGHVSRFIGTFVDITDRRQAEADRISLASKQARLLRLLNEGVLIIEGSGRIVSANNAADSLFGFPAGTLVGRMIEELLPLPAGEEQDCGIQTYLDDPQPGRTGAEEFIQARRADGTVLPVRVNFSGFSDEKSTMMMALISDASAEAARRQAETRAAVAEGARRVAEALVINVMHQMGNHLQDLYNFLRLIEQRQRKGKPGVEAALQESERVARAMTASFDRMQALVRIEAGTAMLKAAPVSCAGLATQAIQEVVRKAKELGIEIVQETMAGTLAADEGLMVEVLRNLLSNALKFSSKGGRITVGASESADAVELWVADTGIGVPESEWEDIFHPLYRGEEVREGRVRGTGVGLAIVQRIIALHGGCVWVEHNIAAATPKNPRGGAVFRLRFPRPS